MVSVLLVCLAAQSPVFRANFNTSNLDASIAKGDAKIYTSSSYRRPGTPGLGGIRPGIVSFAEGEGRNGSGALKFHKKNTAAVFYKAEGNVPPQAGTISFWLRVDPETDLEPGAFVDPLQVTGDAYNDTAIWVDFTNGKPRDFRLGVFGMRVLWNPADLNPDKDPAFNNRLVVVKQPPFAHDKWTHIAIVYRGLGTGKGSARLFVDGKNRGLSSLIDEPFGWVAKRTSIRLGVNYTGWIDDLEVYATQLSAKQIAAMAK